MNNIINIRIRSREAVATAKKQFNKTNWQLPSLQPTLPDKIQVISRKTTEKYNPEELLRSLGIAAEAEKIRDGRERPQKDNVQ